VLAFEGDEALSTPFSYRIEFTSSDHAIAKEMMLMKPGSLTLQAPVTRVTASKCSSRAGDSGRGDRF
jgi:type VI secretion system secreted protein VgrG